MNAHVQKNKLLARLHSNREKHERDYLEMLAKYKEKMCIRAKTLLELSLNFQVRIPAKAIDTFFDCEFPQQYLPKYDRMIGMLEADNGSENSTIELNETDFDKYWNDNWHFSNRFSASKTSYGLQ